MGRKSGIKDRKPTILVTGASGFIGRYFLNAIKDDFKIYALARTSQKKAGIPTHPNIVWVLGDIANEDTVKRITSKIAAKGGVDYVFHLAGYYDYDNKNKPEYYQTNVNGTLYLLQNTEKLNVTRFFYSSSLTVTEFSENNILIDELSPADSNAPYPLSKGQAESAVKFYSSKFPCSIIRVAAIFSDWCEFGPLYMLLTNWLTTGFKSKIIGGKGDTAIPYLHIIDLISFFVSLMENQDKLSSCDVIIASTDDCISHKELFELSTRYTYGQSIIPRFLPKPLSYIGIGVLNTAGKLIGKPTFERPWMVKYLDQQMKVDTSKTQEIISWLPIPRYHIKRRLLYLIENMKSNPVTWKKLNKAALHDGNKERPNVKMYNAIVTLKEQNINKNIQYVMSGKNNGFFKQYQALSAEELRARILYYYHMLEIAIHYGDRAHVLTFIPNLARARYLEGFKLDEIVSLVNYIGQYVVENISKLPGLRMIQSRIESEIMMTIQIIIDEIEDIYDRLKNNHPCNECRKEGIWLCTHDAALTAKKNSRAHA